MTEKLLNVNTKGNKKLVNNESARFMIWNLPAIKTCPYATELCKASCYARKAERVYPSVLPSREANLIEAKSADFVENMIRTIEKHASGKGYKGKKIIFRIHESGDFFNKEYATKWLDIARHFEITGFNIVFVAYTKSLVYFTGEKLPNNFVLRASLWDDTSNENKNLIYEMDLPIYTAFNACDMETATTKNGFTKCECSDCANCGKCWDKSEKKIACVIH